MSGNFKNDQNNTKNNAYTFILRVDGMMCMKNCGTTVQNTLSNVEGVSIAEVDFPSRTAKVCGSASIESLIEAVESIGFHAKDVSKPEIEIEDLEQTYFLKVDGMMCMKNCGNTVQHALRNVKGVSFAEVDFPSKLAKVFGQASIDSLVEAVECVGFDAVSISETEANDLVSKSIIAQSQMTINSNPPPSPGKQEIRLELPTMDSSVPRAILSIEGMSCASCVKSIEDVLYKAPGIIDIKLGLISKRAEVSFSPLATNEDQIVKIISDAGYSAKYLRTCGSLDNSTEIKLTVQGMSNSACASKIEKALLQLSGVIKARIDLTMCQARVGLEQMTSIGPRTLIETINDLGYSATLFVETESSYQLGNLVKREVESWRHLLQLSVSFSLPSILVHFFLSHVDPTKELLQARIVNQLTWKCLIMFLLVSPIQFGVGKRFYVAAYKGILHGMMGMDFLIVVGTTSSYLYSFLSMLLCGIYSDYHGRYFFESSAMLITFVTFGKYLEAVAKGRTADALTHLMNLQPKFATLLKCNEQDNLVKEQQICIDLVQRGDLLRVNPGSSIPTDGIIVSGSTTVNESMITGESMPITKNPGDYVFGSTVNQGSIVTMKAKCGGKEATLSQICTLIEEAQVNKAPIQVYADKIAGIFAPVVLLTSCATFVIWYIILSLDAVPLEWRNNEHDNFLLSLLFGVSVVVVACPCALGLATPTAVMVGCGVGAKNGILIKGGGSLETANKVDTIVFDKTGTLTTGFPSVTDVVLYKKECKRKELLYYVASAETASDHPLAKAIVLTAVEQEKIHLSFPTNVHIRPGGGLSCAVDGKQIIIGNVAWMLEFDINLPKSSERIMNELENDGNTVVCACIEGEFVGMIALADTLRRESKVVIDALHYMGLKVWMVTGDNLRAASAIARNLGIDHVKAVALPSEKVDKISSLQSRGHVVAMVGDGINDAPALTQADVGIAIGAGTEIAVAQADMVLVKSNLWDVVIALDLSRVVFSRIRLNFIFSMSYNIIGIPAAAGVFFPIFHATIPPACAGLAMALSSVSVVLSSLSLNRYRPPNSVDGLSSIKRHWIGKISKVSNSFAKGKYQKLEMQNQ